MWFIVLLSLPYNIIMFLCGIIMTSKISNIVTDPLKFNYIEKKIGAIVNNVKNSYELPHLWRGWELPQEHFSLIDINCVFVLM